MNKTLGFFARFLMEDSDSPLFNDHREITGITSDSRDVQPGFIFVAVQGGSQDGRQFIEAAVKKGAVLIVMEGKAISPLSENMSEDVPVLGVKDARKTLAELASLFYSHPSLSLLMIGVTGTSGKTTTTYLVESILKSAGHRVGVIGTISFRFGTKIFPSTHTTPGPVELQRLLFQMKEAGCTAVVMEVSSHALKQKRVGSIAFDGMIFTNLSPEHLDFHPDMDDYFRSKAELFGSVREYSLTQGKLPVAAINEDDEYGRRLLSTTLSVGSALVRGYSVGPNLEVTPDGISGNLNGVQVQSCMTGHFNCSNIAAAVSLAQLLGIQTQVIENGIRGLPGVPGRLERVSNELGIHVWVDYAHKPDALEKVLRTLAELKSGHRLITVFGCGGDRDRKKRPLMGKIAVDASDWVIVTSDNPRTEDPQAIILEIVEGIKGSQNFQVEVDRRLAIFKAIETAKAGDLVLIAGKGHEDYQILGTKKIHFDDREVAQEVFRARGSSRLDNS